MKHENARTLSVRRASEPSFHPRLRAALAAVVILAFSTPIFAQAAKNKKPASANPAGSKNPAAAAAQPKSEREQANAQVFGRLAQAWAAAFSGKSQEAIALAEPVAKLSDPDYKWAAIEATHIQARAYHQSGTAQGRARAAQLWKQIERLDTSKATKARLQIAKALEAEARACGEPGRTANPAANPSPSKGEVPPGAGLPAVASAKVGGGAGGGVNPSAIKQAIDTLEPLLKAGRWNLVEAEAALDLSRLYVQANRFDDAKKTLDYIVAYLGVKKNLIVLEIPPGLEKPYIAAAKAAIAHLKYDKNIGLAEFEAAEKLRKAGKFADAMRAYQAVIAIVKNFPESDYSPRSDLHVGDCLLGLGQTARAIEHWKKFIAPAPAGPWRGQAYIGIIDYCLEEQLDLPEAGKYADLARNSLPAALRSRSPSEASAKEGGEAGESWSLVAFDIQLRVGLVSFCQGNSAQAVAAFQAAKAATTSKATAESLDALIAAAKSGKAVIPEDCFASGTGASAPRTEAGPALRSLGEAGSGQSAPGAPGRNPLGTGPQSAIDQPSLALSMGIIHLLAGRHDNADNMFDRILGPNPSPSGGGKGGSANPSPTGGGKGGGTFRLPTSDFRIQQPPLPGSSPAQLAFAAFGRGAVLHAQRKSAAAKDLFLASIKSFPAGSWHDETLYRLATITQDEADAKPSPAAGGGKEKPKDPKQANPSPLTGEVGPPAPKGSGPGEGVAAAAIRNQQRLAAFINAKSAALPYWQEIISRYPKSPRCEQAFYNAGVLLCEIAETSDAAGSGEQGRTTAAQSETNWKDAAFMLGRFTEFYPKSPFAGDAYVREIDIALERMFDLKLAKAIGPQASQWAEGTADARQHIKAATLAPNLPAWSLLKLNHGTAASNSITIYGCYLRAGIVAYLCGDMSLAQKSFVAAKLLAPPLDFEVVRGHVPKGIERLTEATRLGRRLTPDEAMDKTNEKASLILQLADLYDLNEDYDKSLELSNLILTGKVPSTNEQKSWAAFRRGRACFCLDWDHRDPIAAKKDYLAAVEAAPKASWAYRGLFLAGNIAFNTEHDVDGAVAIWQRMLKQYPGCPEAHRAAYYIGVAYELGKQPEKAKEAFDAFLRAFPDSPFAELVHQHHLKNLSKLQQEKETRS